MSLFYDPKTKKAKVWIIAAFIIVPILILAITWVFGKQQTEQKKHKSDLQQEPDLFK